MRHCEKEAQGDWLLILAPLQHGCSALSGVELHALACLLVVKACRCESFCSVAAFVASQRSVHKYEKTIKKKGMLMLPFYVSTSCSESVSLKDVWHSLPLSNCFFLISFLSDWTEVTPQVRFMHWKTRARSLWADWKHLYVCMSADHLSFKVTKRSIKELSLFSVCALHKKGASDLRKGAVILAKFWWNPFCVYIYIYIYTYILVCFKMLFQKLYVFLKINFKC